MNYFEILKESTSTLLLNKMRTGLAILGIVIGIASVIALLSIGEASQQSITNSINSLGVNLLTVNPGAARTGGLVRGATGGGTTLTYGDALALANDDSLSAIETVAPVYSARSQVVYSDSNTNTTITGVTPDYASVRNISIESGAFLSDSDVSGITNVAVLGPTVVQSLFGDDVVVENIIGEVIRIGNLSFNVIGVTKEKGSSGVNNQDDVIYIPISTAQKKLFGVKYVSSILVEAKSSDVMIMAMNQIGYTLLSRHGISEPTKADFNIRNSADMLETVSSVTGTLTSLLSGVAAISLLVGGIGIMNIMLVTVTERTREIGLRKALGAKDRLIITQFLFEAIVLTFVGGVIGILVGVVLAFAYAKLQNSLFIISTSAIGLAFLTSAIIGLVFGWYPAKRASLLQPIEALRYE
ncbi:ABC transporter permease [Candidatus Woesebacteria bacterium]|nr:ABC transporter permease [Candidatus Woesebacteria bacterium]